MEVRVARPLHSSDPQHPLFDKNPIFLINNLFALHRYCRCLLIANEIIIVVDSLAMFACHRHRPTRHPCQLSANIGCQLFGSAN